MRKGTTRQGRHKLLWGEGWPGCTQDSCIMLDGVWLCHCLSLEIKCDLRRCVWCQWTKLNCDSLAHQLCRVYFPKHSLVLLYFCASICSQLTLSQGDDPPWPCPVSSETLITGLRFCWGSSSKPPASTPAWGLTCCPALQLQTIWSNHAQPCQFCFLTEAESQLWNYGVQLLILVWHVNQWEVASGRLCHLLSGASSLACAWDQRHVELLQPSLMFPIPGSWLGGLVRRGRPHLEDIIWVRCDRI
jgi:hypothetical protein